MTQKLYRDKKVVISGGGDSALDWAIFLSNVASEVTLIHRRNEFRGALDSVDTVQELKNLGKINLITPAEVKGVLGNEYMLLVLLLRKKEKNLLLLIQITLFRCLDYLQS